MLQEAVTVGDQKDWDSMVESRTDREIFAEMNEMKVIDAKHIVDQPKVTDFTEIEELHSCSTDKFVLRVIMDSGKKYGVGRFPSREDAEDVELALHQMAIEYRTKRNEWETKVANG